MSLTLSCKKLLDIPAGFWTTIRNASKKTGGSTKNPKEKGRPKHRGWRVQDGHFVSQGTILATQLKPRFHPGLNVIIYLSSMNKVIMLINQLLLGGLWKEWNTIC